MTSGLSDRVRLVGPIEPATKRGLCGAFAGHRWMRRGTNLWLHTLEEWPLAAWQEGGHWRMVAMGLRGVDLSGDGPPRPTNDLLQWLDGRVTRNRLDLDAERWRGLLDGRLTEIPDVDRGHRALGLVLPHGDAHLVGWGFVRDGRLKDHIPRGRRKWLRNVVSTDVTASTVLTDPTAARAHDPR